MGSAVVGAQVGDGEELAANVEDDDRLFLKGVVQPRAGR